MRGLGCRLWALGFRWRKDTCGVGAAGFGRLWAVGLCALGATSHPSDRTGRVNRSRTEVIRIDQLNRGSSFRFIEKQRMLRIVRKMFREVRAEDRPETSRLPPPCLLSHAPLSSQASSRGLRQRSGKMHQTLGRCTF